MFLIFDTETTGLPRNYEAPVSDTENWPRLVQIAWQIHDASGNLVEAENIIVKPDGFTIPFNSEKVHGISTEKALKEGVGLSSVLEKFHDAVSRSDVIVGHNVEFDQKIMGAEFYRMEMGDPFEGKVIISTDEEALEYCQLPGGRGGGYKLPALHELHEKLFGAKFEEAHNAAADVVATARSFLELIRLGVITAEKLRQDEEFVVDFKKKNKSVIKPAEVKFESLKKDTGEKTGGIPSKVKKEDKEKVAELSFSHLHVHTQYSVLNATTGIEELVDMAAGMEMPAVAITDHGNLFGAVEFVNTAKKKGVKPIIGCELFLSRDRKRTKFTKDNPDVRHNQVLLAKSKTGYENLSKLSSLGYIEGLYGLYPRVDKELIANHKEGLIALTGGLQSEIPDLILNVGEHQAEEALIWWKEQFGDDFYVQLNRHGLEAENHVNEVLLELARKHDVKVIAANNVYYLKKEDAESHDILLCIQNAEYQATPVGEGRGFRFGFPNQEFYFKSQEEMKKIFADLPESIATVSEVVEKIEDYELRRDPIMPDFPLPEGFDNADDYLKHITYEGAAWRYGEVTQEIRERIEFELDTVKKMGYPGYFLIVQDILQKAREMDVSVGPGRGSAAGSVVAYCLRITDVDPLKFNLLFERFLNPDRISLPDIDIDFDEDGRDRILKWVVETYGSGKVAQIITFGKMAPKMAIRDVARVKQLPLAEADRLAKLIPGTPGTTFKMAYKEIADLARERKEGDDLVKNTLENSERLEGTIRNTGTHACGIIIGRDDLIEHIPLSLTKDSEFLATQYEGSLVESVGMLKMDFLGLKTLSIIRDALKNIKLSKKIDLDIEQIPYDDSETYELFSRGDTTGIFQFESDGMKKHLRDLKPNRFEDLIAMNALYRPGPMEYIPSYVKRKYGKEKIEYDIPEMREILEETYGITVYQEQVMLLSQKLAGFTKGEADSLRKGMGKKKKEILDELKPKFFKGCAENGYDEKVVDKIWQDWEAFAKYAFNKSHSTCYAVVAYRMAYLKAHYPAEFMAAVLSRNLNDIKKITFFIDECRRQNIQVLGPDVNESHLHFVVNKNGEIRFGMAAIKGVGEGAVRAIVEEREENGPFKNIFDFARRVNLKAVNKRSMEALAMAGAFDAFEGVHRAQYFYRENSDDSIFLEKVIRFASQYQEKVNASQNSLFGDEIAVEIPDPEVPAAERWSKLQQLKSEKDVTGFYISGHPLDDYKLEVDSLCNVSLEDLDNRINDLKNKAVSFAGMITSVESRMSKSGNQFANFSLEDFTDTFRLVLFSEDYLKYRHLLVEGSFVMIRARIEPNRRNPSRMEIRVNQMLLLGEAIERFIKKVNLQIDLKNLSDDLIRKIGKVIANNPGNSEVILKVMDSDDKVSVQFYPRKNRVNPGSLARELKRISYIDYSLVQ